MRQELMSQVVARGGLIHRDAALRVVPEHVLKDAVRARALIRVFPEVFALPERAGETGPRRRAALLYRPDAALSHTDALDVWRLLPVDSPAGQDIHLTTGRDAPSKAPAGLRIHRVRGFDVSRCLVREGLRVVRLEEAVVSSWPLLPRVHQRAPAIVAVRERKTTADRLLGALTARPGASGALEMKRLFGLLAFGVHSELELFGHERVFVDRRLPPSRAQVRVRTPTGRVVYLDRLFEAEMVVVELDGAAYHSDRRQRERDARRDAELAGLGYLTIRVTHARLVQDAPGFVQELVRILEMRRRQLGLVPA